MGWLRWCLRYARTVYAPPEAHDRARRGRGFIGGVGACAGYDALLFYCAVDDTPAQPARPPAVPSYVRGGVACAAPGLAVSRIQTYPAS